VKRESDGGEVKVCIDGKQRLTSIQQCVVLYLVLCLWTTLTHVMAQVYEQ
jgi:hypothetical protein